MGGHGAHWYAGGGALWQKENVHCGNLRDTLGHSYHLRGKGHSLSAGQRTHPSSPAVEILGLGFVLLSGLFG